MGRTRQVVMLVLFASLAAGCSETTTSSSPGDGTISNAPTYTPYPTYTLFPTYTPVSLLPDAQSLVWPKGPRDDVILWTGSADFVGTEMIVEGTVVRTYNSGKAVFLNFAEDYQGTFSVVIFPDDWAKFPRPPETLFYGRRIRVQGLIEQYQGVPEVVVRDPWQIEVALTLGQEEACDCSAPAVVQILATATPLVGDESAQTSKPAEPTTDVTEAPVAIEVVNWQDTAACAGRVVAVEGQVVDTYNSGKVVFLNFDEDYRHTFKVVIFPDAWPLFPQPPEIMYRGRLVRVTGQVEMYQGAPEIIVEIPEAIEILE